MRVYVASSWRNEHQPRVVRYLIENGHSVYDFRNPVSGNHGFSWSQIDPDWKGWGPMDFAKGLRHHVAITGFSLDMSALALAEATVLVMPCGRSAHLELGYACGAKQRTAVLLTGPSEPELMYLMCGLVTDDMSDIARFLE